MVELSTERKEGESVMTVPRGSLGIFVAVEETENAMTGLMR